MATETSEPTSLQTGNTPNPIASNAQDFSGSDDEIMDNFGDGQEDDGTPMGLGGEKGKQSEPASSTLESDIANGTKTGEDVPPDDSATPEPVQETGEHGPEDVPGTDEPETPEFPPVLLQMAGYADADAAIAAGLGSPEALAAYVRGRGELLASVRRPDESSDQPLYKRRDYQEPVEPAVAPKETDGVTPFQLPPEKMEMLDEELQEVIRQMNDHYQQEVTSIRASLTERESVSVAEQERQEALRFDKDVQALGEAWQDVFGEGDGRHLIRAGRSDPAARLASEYRGELFQHVQDIREDNAAKGLEPLDRQQEILYALMRQFPSKFQQVNSVSSAGSRRGVTASRPTQRKTPPKSQNEATVAAVDAMLRKRHGYGLSRSTRDEFDGEI